ncbi:TetR/AcrR family transcriptional regulator [Pseudonocardia sp. CA-107938]|uniref:TetR/AcrR family transcriptional regulator n=1 Tax=Pseudonocardia sp. CA-107938 TaxID=3240021 RepID=UPI003D90FA7C
MTRPSLRERQRLEVRAELQRTAISMFLEQGFDNVAITDIAERVGVVQRTFYRHFATKEDAVLSLLDDVAPVVHAHVRDHPSGFSPAQVLASAMKAASRRYQGVSSQVVLMIARTPKLLTAYYDRQRRWAEEVAVVLAERLAVDPLHDPRPGLWAVIAFEITSRVTFENIARDAQLDPLEGLDELFEKAGELFTSRLP